MKKCIICGKHKEESEFHKSRGNKDGLHSYCKICNREHSKKWRNKDIDKTRIYYNNYYKDNPEKFKVYKKKYYEKNKESLKEYAKNYENRYNKYGITVEEYNRLFEKQGGCCSICKKHQSEFKKTLAVDHDHKTGRVRGLLCSNCNIAIGLFNENKHMIFSAFEYLNSFPE